MNVTNRGATVSSKDIERIFGKTHDKVLRDIEKHRISLANFGERDSVIEKYAKEGLHYKKIYQKIKEEILK